jgi:hypothetical protein
MSSKINDVKAIIDDLSKQNVTYIIKWMVQTMGATSIVNCLKGINPEAEAIFGTVEEQIVKDNFDKNYPQNWVTKQDSVDDLKLFIINICKGKKIIPIACIPRNKDYFTVKFLSEFDDESKWDYLIVISKQLNDKQMSSFDLCTIETLERLIINNTEIDFDISKRFSSGNIIKTYMKYINNQKKPHLNRQKDNFVKRLLSCLMPFGIGKSWNGFIVRQSDGEILKETTTMKNEVGYCDIYTTSIISILSDIREKFEDTRCVLLGYNHYKPKQYFLTLHDDKGVKEQGPSWNNETFVKKKCLKYDRINTIIKKNLRNLYDSPDKVVKILNESRVPFHYRIHNMLGSNDKNIFAPSGTDPKTFIGTDFRNYRKGDIYKGREEHQSSYKQDVANKKTTKPITTYSPGKKPKPNKPDLFFDVVQSCEINSGITGEIEKRIKKYIRKFALNENVGYGSLLHTILKDLRMKKYIKTPDNIEPEDIKTLLNAYLIDYCVTEANKKNIITELRTLKKQEDMNKEKITTKIIETFDKSLRILGTRLDIKQSFETYLDNLMNDEPSSKTTGFTQKDIKKITSHYNKYIGVSTKEAIMQQLYKYYKDNEKLIEQIIEDIESSKTITPQKIDEKILKICVDHIKEGGDEPKEKITKRYEKAIRTIKQKYTNLPDDYIKKILEVRVNNESSFGMFQRKFADKNIYLLGMRMGKIPKFFTSFFDGKEWKRGFLKTYDALKKLYSKNSKMKVTKKGFDKFIKLKKLTLPKKFNLKTDIPFDPLEISAFGYYKGFQLYPMGKNAYCKGRHQGVSSTYSQQFSEDNNLWNPKKGKIKGNPEPIGQFQYGKGRNCFGKSTPNEWSKNVYNSYTGNYQNGIGVNKYNYKGTQSVYGGNTGVSGYPSLSNQVIKQGLVPLNY